MLSSPRTLATEEWPTRLPVEVNSRFLRKLRLAAFPRGMKKMPDPPLDATLCDTRA